MSRSRMFSNRSASFPGEPRALGRSIALILTLAILVAMFLFLPAVQFLFLTIFLVVTAVLLIKPEWGLYPLIFIVPLSANYSGFYFTATGVGAISTKTIPLFASILIGAVIGLTMEKAARLDNGIPSVFSLTVPMILLLCYAVFSLSWAPYTMFGILTSCYMLLNFLLYGYFVAAINRVKTHNGLIICWIVAGVITSIFVAFSFHDFPPIRFYTLKISDTLEYVYNNFTRFHYRGHALGHPNVASALLNLIICANVGLLTMEKKRGTRVLLWCSLGIMIFSNMLTQSKAGLGSFLAMGLFLLICLEKLRKKLFPNIFFSVIGVAVILLVSMTYLNYSTHKDRSLRIFTLSTGSSEEITSMQHRYAMWRAGWGQMNRRDLVLLGLGPGGFEKTTNYPHSHNLYFSFFFDLGIAGVVFEICVIYCFLRAIWKFMKNNFSNQTTYAQVMTMSLIGGLLAFSIHSTVDQYYYKPVLWLYLGLLAASFKLVNAEPMKKDENER